MFPPNLWEYSKSPWLFGLSIKFIRRDQQHAPNVADFFTTLPTFPSPGGNESTELAAAFQAVVAYNSEEKDTSIIKQILQRRRQAAPLTSIGTKRGSNEVHL